MTDEPDLCCTHGEPILQRLDRLVELMEIVAETRKRPCAVCPDGPRPAPDTSWVKTQPTSGSGKTADLGWRRWLKRIGIGAAFAIGFAGVLVSSWWLWGVFIRMHS